MGLVQSTLTTEARGRGISQMSTLLSNINSKLVNVYTKEVKNNPKFVNVV